MMQFPQGFDEFSERSKRITVPEIWNELIKRMCDEALLLIINFGDRLITFKEFEDEWNKEYPNKSFFK